MVRREYRYRGSQARRSTASRPIAIDSQGRFCCHRGRSLHLACRGSVDGSSLSLRREQSGKPLVDVNPQASKRQHYYYRLAIVGQDCGHPHGLGSARQLQLQCWQSTKRRVECLPVINRPTPDLWATPPDPTSVHGTPLKSKHLPAFRIERRSLARSVHSNSTVALRGA